MVEFLITINVIIFVLLLFHGIKIISLYKVYNNGKLKTSVVVDLIWDLILNDTIKLYKPDDMNFLMDYTDRLSFISQTSLENRIYINYRKSNYLVPTKHPLHKAYFENTLPLHDRDELIYNRCCEKYPEYYKPKTNNINE